MIGNRWRSPSRCPPVSSRGFSFHVPFSRVSRREIPFVDESELIARVLVGEREAFHALFQRHSAPLLATLSSTLSNREDAREVLQETWLRAFQNLATLRDRARLRPWLVSIALNLARARLRRPLERALPSQDEAELVQRESEVAEQDAELAALRERMADLPRRQREVVDLRVSHELSHAEIAALLGISEDASRANFYQALRHLKGSLRARRTS